MADSKASYFLFGLGLGVAIGVLFAPQSGEETRKLIGEKAGEGRDYLKKKSEEVRESGSTLLSRGREVIQGQKDNLTAALEAGRQAYRETLATGQSKAAG